MTKPYSEECHWKNVITKQTHDDSKAKCEDIKKRSLILTSEAWRIIRTDIQNNCAQSQCTELTGKMDQIFLDIDKGLNKLPW